MPKETNRSVRDRLIEEFDCAITAVLGDNEEKDEQEYQVDASDIDAIAKKVKFYMDLK